MAVFHLKEHFSRRKSATKLLCVQTISSIVVRHSPICRWNWSIFPVFDLKDVIVLLRNTNDKTTMCAYMKDFLYLHCVLFLKTHYAIVMIISSNLIWFSKFLDC